MNHINATHETELIRGLSDLKYNYWHMNRSYFRNIVHVRNNIGCNIYILAIALLLCSSNLVLADYLYYSKPAYQGTIYDGDDGKPIEGVIVVAEYLKYTLHFPHAYQSLIYVQEAKTDIIGNFRIPAYSTFINPFSRGIDPLFVIFKPGYAYMDGSNPEKIFKNENPYFPVVFWNGREDIKIKMSPGKLYLPRLKTIEDRRRNEPGTFLAMPSDAPFLYLEMGKEIK